MRCITQGKKAIATVIAAAMLAAQVPVAALALEEGTTDPSTTEEVTEMVVATDETAKTREITEVQNVAENTAPEQETEIDIETTNSAGAVTIGSTPYASLALAVAAAKDGDTLKVNEALGCIPSPETTNDITIVIDKKITFDLNGHEVTIGNGPRTSRIKVAENGDLTLVDSSEQGNGTLKSGTDYSGKKENGVAVGNSYGMIEVWGNFTMQRGKIDAVRADAVNKGQYAVSVKGSGNVTINGGTIEAGWYAISGNGSLTNGSTITVNGGTLTSTEDYTIYHPQAGTLTINDGTLSGGCGVVAMNAGDLTVKGGKFSSEGKGSTGSWTDGTGNNKLNMGKVLLNVRAGYGSTDVKVEGGTFTVPKDGSVPVIKNDYNDANKNTAEVAVSGGTFNADITAWVAPGFAPVKDKDGNYTTEVKYETVKFDAQGGTPAPADITTLKYNDPVGTLPTVTRAGYTFKGWYTAATGGDKISAATLVTDTADYIVTYYAQWDLVPAAPAPAQDAGGFTDRLYTYCLSRSADATGRAYWVEQLTSYKSSGTKVAYGFVFSNEFTAKKYNDNDFVETLYKTFLGRTADATGKTYWVKQLQSGTSREDVFYGFANSNEFVKICKTYGIGNTDVDTFVTRLYLTCFGRNPDEAGLANWTQLLRSNSASASEVAYGFVFSKEFSACKYSDADYVEHLYAALFGRESDAAGRAYWAKQLQDGANRKDVFEGFIGSREFAELCGNYDIRVK